MRVWRTFLSLAKANAELGGALVDRLCRSEDEQRWRVRAEHLLREALAERHAEGGNGRATRLGDDWAEEAELLLSCPPGSDEYEERFS